MRALLACLADLVIDDDVEGETMLGDGRAGVIQFNNHNNGNAPVEFKGLQPKPAKTKTHRRGLAGPIGSGGLEVQLHTIELYQFTL